MLLKKETQKLRKYTDFFAYWNYSGYKELIYFEDNFVRSFLANFEEMMNKSINLLQSRHEGWAELICDFGDIKKILKTKTSVIR